MKSILFLFCALLITSSGYSQRYYIRLGKNDVPVASSVVNRATMPVDGNKWRDITDASMGLEKQYPTSSGTDWIPTDVWLDGTPMVDADTFSGWFEKRDGIYYRRNWPAGQIMLRELGFRNGDDARTDIYPLWERLRKYAPGRGSFGITVDPGLYFSSKEIVIEDINWRITGWGATIIFPGNVQAMHVRTSGPGGIDGAIITGLGFASQGGAVWDGVIGATYGMSKERPAGARYYYQLDKKTWVDSTGREITPPAKSSNVKDYKYNGILVEAKCEIGYCRINNFSACGIANFGGNASTGNNTSQSYIHDNEIGNIGLHGIFSGGADGSVASIVRNNLREIEGVGDLDESMYGGYHEANMLHYARKGGFVSRLVTNNSVFIANYTEGSPYPGNSYSDGTLYLGGTLMNGNTGGEGFSPFERWRIRGIDKISLRNRSVLFDARDGDANKRWAIVDGPIDDSYDDQAKRFTGGLSFNASNYKPSVMTLLESESLEYGKPVGGMGIAVREMVEIGTIRHFAMTPAEAMAKGIQLRKGDRFETEDTDFIVTKGGDKPEWKAR